MTLNRERRVTEKREPLRVGGLPRGQGALSSGQQAPSTLGPPRVARALLTALTPHQLTAQARAGNPETQAALDVSSLAGSAHCDPASGESQSLRPTPTGPVTRGHVAGESAIFSCLTV